MWKLVLQEIFGVDFHNKSEFPVKITDCTELYRKRIEDLSLDKILVCAAYE